MTDHSIRTSTSERKQSILYDAIIIGGGLAGLCCSIHLAKQAFKVLLIEPNRYPKHKVCGEYVSNEVIPYLHYLGFQPKQEKAKNITSFELSAASGKMVSSTLPLGGFGMSRFRMDKSLADLAIQSGVKIKHDKVDHINYGNEVFTITTEDNEIYHAQIAIGAFGKRSSLDLKLQRQFVKKKSPFLAVKIHAKGEFPDDVVALHNFKGGYCGVSKVENNDINLCYIASYSAFKKYKNIEEFQKNVVFRNKHLARIFAESKPTFKKPLTISQISFATKTPVEKHMIMCGDSAGMIHPLCGNGMGMAIRSAYLASELIVKYLKKEISRDALEKSYIYTWNKVFRRRLKFGHLAAWLFNHTGIIEFCMPLLKIFPGILPRIIRFSHGKPMTIS